MNNNGHQLSNVKGSVRFQKYREVGQIRQPFLVTSRTLGFQPIILPRRGRFPGLDAPVRLQISLMRNRKVDHLPNTGIKDTCKHFMRDSSELGRPRVVKMLPQYADLGGYLIIDHILTYL